MFSFFFFLFFLSFLFKYLDKVTVIYDSSQIARTSFFSFICIFFFVRRQHVFVNTRRQFALYHRYVWCPKTSVDLNRALGVLERCRRGRGMGHLSSRVTNAKGPRLQALLAAVDHCSNVYIVYFVSLVYSKAVMRNRPCTPAYARVTRS